MPVRTIWVYATSDGAAAGTAAFLLEALRRHAGPTRYALALSGGTTPNLVYQRLTSIPETAGLMAEKAELFFSDERAVPPDHQDSNYGLARRLLLEPLGISGSVVHRMRGEASDLAAEAARYEAEMRQALGTPTGAKPVFDLILLGMGEDGHTASLFPGNETGEWEDRDVLAQGVPAGGARRLSFSLGLINRSRIVLFLVTGERKREMVKKVLSPEGMPYIPPAARVAGRRTIWVLDESAAQLLDRRLVRVEQR